MRHYALSTAHAVPVEDVIGKASPVVAQSGSPLLWNITELTEDCDDGRMGQFRVRLLQKRTKMITANYFSNLHDIECYMTVMEWI